MIWGLDEGIGRVEFVMWLGCLLRRVEASVVYVGRPSASEVLGLAYSPPATACHSPQTFDNEYMPFVSLVIKHAECVRQGKSTV
jgi:hypothetical protein